MGPIASAFKLTAKAAEVISSGIEAGNSGLEILRTLQSIGEGIRKQTLYQVLNFSKGLPTPAKKYIDYLTLNSLPTIDRLPKSLTAQLRNFAYRVSIEGYNYLTGERPTTYITISSNELLTKQQAIDTATAYAEGQGKSGALEEAVGHVTDVMQNSAGLVL